MGYRNVRWSIYAVLLTIPVMILASARDESSKPDGSVEYAQQSRVNSPEYFPAKARLRYAKGFTLEYHDTYKRIEVSTPWRDSQETFTYLLIPRGYKLPSPPSDAVVIEVPIERIVLLSSTNSAFFAMLNLEETLVGMARTRQIVTPEIAKRISLGHIVEVSLDTSGMTRNLNMEMLCMLQPEAILVYGTGIPELDLQPKLAQAGFRVLIDGSYMEPVPLGRAEWIKFIAAFFNKEKEAERIFDEIATSYENRVEQVKGVKTRPTVFYGTTYKNVWYMPGGESYVAQFYTDAGADYLWRDDRTRGSMPMSFEAVMERARDADFWLDPGIFHSLRDLEASDDRYRLFRAFQKGQVFQNDAQFTPEGGNDYWETGIARPDLVLADLISIFHPDLIPGHKRIWYRKLPPEQDDPR